LLTGVSTTVEEEIQSFLTMYLLSEEDVTAKDAVNAAAKEFPEASVLSLTFSLVCCAAAFDDPLLLQDDNDAVGAFELYRCSAALSADLFGLHSIGHRDPNCRQLVEFWAMTDDTFFGPPRLPMKP
jgi:hypothetical protein